MSAPDRSVWGAPGGERLGMAQRAGRRAKKEWGALARSVAAGLALVPLWALGATLPPPPRTPLADRTVSQGEWADRLVDALALGPGLDPGATDLARFRLLCPRETQRGPGEAGRSAEAVPVEIVDPGPPVRARVRVAVGTLYVLVVEGRGAQRWRVGSQSAGALDPTALEVDVAPKLLALAAGEHELTADAEGASSVARVTLVPYTGVCIAPRDGWQGDRSLDFATKARTLVQALGLEDRLPLADDGVGIEGEQFVHASEGVRATDAPVGAPASGGRWARAEGRPADLGYRLEIARPGVYSVIARIHGPSRQLWTLGSGAPLPVYPDARATGFAWTAVATQTLAAGVLDLRARLADGSGVDAIRLLRRDTGDEDYLDVLASAGLVEGPSGAPVSEEAAGENLGSPLVRASAAGFVDRLASPVGWALGGVESELRSLYTRPLSPFLPSDL